jgi:hypothetical protein
MPSPLQLFWEAFPAAGGDRTTYMFGYMDAHPGRPTFAALLDKYLQQLPEYQVCVCAGSRGCSCELNAIGGGVQGLLAGSRALAGTFCA